MADIEEYEGRKEGRNILEVGNVLSHYFRVHHDVIDKYEKTNGVINIDAVDFDPPKRYDLIVTISTLEHVGWNENSRDSTKIPSAIENLKGLIIAGPGPTKYDFEKGEYLNYMLKDKIIDIIDTSYVSEQGVKEVVEKAPEIMRKIRYIEEKKIMQQFLYEVGHDTGIASYGEEEVRKALEAGAVKTLLLSEKLDIVRVKVKCSACDYEESHTMKSQMITAFEQSLSGKPCPKCTAPSLSVAETQDLIDYFAQLAEYTNTEVEIISGETEEGQMLKNSFGGIAAILRFKTNH